MIDHLGRRGHKVKHTRIRELYIIGPLLLDVVIVVGDRVG
jgi:hypothetical protein